MLQALRQGRPALVEKPLATTVEDAQETVDAAAASACGACHAGFLPRRDIVSPYIQLNEPLLVQDSHFIECIRTGATPNTSGERGLDIVRVLSATDVAESTGRRISCAILDGRGGSA